EKAFEWGLITRLFEDDVVEVEAMKIAQKLADGPTRALALTRQSAWAAADSSFTETLQLERVLQRDAGNHPDFAEGVAAFMEKRVARFGG
ncbi:MAG TPA: 2-(1,2-epoxy-1,2-dihydrophenyl)acetyl-CoA isomerase, partial [Sulfitobacter sp.]|nr:2-(1,2-epoxy-1,2-dihydrophenyl)acetyl-CoA isomerase [Sulfitobacter sp.]